MKSSEMILQRALVRGEGNNFARLFTPGKGEHSGVESHFAAILGYVCKGGHH